MEASVQPAGAAEGAAEGGEDQGYSGQFAGQGEGDQGSGLYDLDSAPPEVRPFLEQELKKIEANVTRKFTEHAQFREQLGPLAEMDGLGEVSPEEMQGLLAFRQLAQDPEQFTEWLQEMSQQLGLDGEEAGEVDEDSWLEMGIENGWFDGDEEGGNEQPDADQLRSSVLEEIAPQLEQFQEYLSQQQQTQAVQEAQQELDQRLKGLAEEHGETLDLDAVLELAHGFVAQGSEDPLGDAAERYLSIRGSIEGGVVDTKLDQSGSSTSGGRADTSPEGYGFDSPDLKNAALQRMKS